MKMTANHRIVYTSLSGSRETAKPGDSFEINDQDGEFLAKCGAARKVAVEAPVEAPKPRRRRTTKEAEE